MALAQVLVPIANGSEEMEAVIITDVLRRSGTQVTVASVEKNSLQVVASREIKLVADKLITDCQHDTFDLIVLPGGMPGAERLRDSKTLRQIVERHDSEGRQYAAICAAPAVALKSWGLLEGIQATAHPAFVDQLGDATSARQRVVWDRHVSTSRGPGTAFEFALSLVEALAGRKKREEVEGPLVLPKLDGTDIFRLGFDAVPEETAGPHHPPQVLVPIANGSEEMEAVIIVDVLRRSGVQVTVASVEENSLQVVAARGVKLVADKPITDCQLDTFDLIVLPGGMPGSERLRDSAELALMLRSQAASGRWISAICAAPAVVLVSQGLLPEGAKATAHPAFSSNLNNQSAVEARVVKDGNFVTSRGPGTAIEFALALVELLFDSEKAAAVAAPMVLDPAIKIGRV